MTEKIKKNVTDAIKYIKSNYPSQLNAEEIYRYKLESLNQLERSMVVDHYEKKHREYWEKNKENIQSIYGYNFFEDYYHQTIDYDLINMIIVRE